MEALIQAIDRNILKVVYREGKKEHKSGAQILPETEADRTQACQICAGQAEGELVFQTEEGIFARQTEVELIPKEVFRYTFSGNAPVIVTKKTIDGERAFVENADTVKVADAYEGRIAFRLSQDEAIYGLGQQENGVYNYRNVKEYLYQNNMKIPMPVILSSRQYAILFDAGCMFTYEEKAGKMTFTFDAVDDLTYYVIKGDCMDELVKGIRTLTGKAVMLPKWAFGYVQSKERYKTQEEILTTAEEFQKRDIPVSCLVLDWHSWEEGKWGNKIFDKSRFPDAKAMVEELHKKGIAFMISVWPNMNQGTENNEEMAKAGKLLMNLSTYDAFDEEARDLYWDQCERELFAAGTDAWWCDSTEPFTPDWNGAVKRPDETRYQMAKDSTNQYLDARESNLFALKHAQGIYEHQRAVCSQKRVANLTRSGSLGSQRYGTILWSGDIAATWDVLKNQIAEGLSISMSGIPYWTLDAGAFFTGTLECWRKFINDPQAKGPQPWFWHGLFEKGVEDLGYRELYVRWLQFSTYLPMMRSHGTDTPREPWQFGEAGSVYYDTIVKYIRKRYAMLPYTYSLAWKVYRDDYTMLRSLMFDFAQDEAVKELKEEFMYGPSYLVCPVTDPMEYGPESTPIATSGKVEIYLPKGADWYAEETEQYFEGGQKLLVEAGVDTMPVFIRAGSVIPKASQATGSMDELHVYAGADGSFELYEDGGEDYEYESGVYSLITFRWEDSRRKLCVKAEKTEFGYPEKFEVFLHEKGTVQKQEVVWDGTGTEILL